MKKNKKFYGLIGGVMVLALALPLITYNIAKADTLYSDVVAWYNFDDQTLDNIKGDDNAKAIITGLTNYSGSLVYGEDRDSSNTEGHAVKLGEYGIELNEQNLGDNFSVSLWVKPDGTLNANQSVLFLGYSSPEDWYGIAGNTTGTNEVKIWCRNPSVSSYNGWITKATTTIDSSSWHHVVITGDGTTHNTYIDGKLITSSDFSNVLSGENQDIYLGVTYWDEEFTGYVDDVIVYKRTISAGEVERLYTGQTAEELLEDSEVSVSDLSTVVGREETLNVTVPEAVKEDAKITYDIADTSIATVSKDGVVTGVKAGTTTVDVKVKIGDTTKTATGNITVVSSLTGYLVADLSLDGDLTDTTGNCNVSLYTKGLSLYTSDASYVDGVDGKAIDLSGYGFDLGLKNVGSDFTVSFYVNPDTTQVANQIMVQLGYHNPELWTSISGTGTDGSYKLWGNTASAATTNGSVTSMAWTTVLSPTISTGEWSLVTLVGTDGTITAYVDGLLVGSGGYNNPLCGDNQSIYFGVNNWDTCFDGKFDDIKVYSIALSQDEIIEANSDFISKKLQSNLELATAYDEILGINERADEVKYSLVLPQTLGSTDISWTSSNEKIIAADGTVVNPDEDTEVSLTASVALGDAQATVTRTFMVLSLDRSALDALIDVAESYDLTYATEVSAGRLTDAISEAKSADSFETIDSSLTRLQKAIAGLEYDVNYLDPFAVIADATASVNLTEGKSETVFVIPDSVLEMVNVDYESSDDSVCSYSDGQVKAKSAGSVIVTAVVTAKSDGYVMNYSTAVDVTEKSTGSDSSSASNNTGSTSSSTGSSSSNSGSSSSSSSGSGSSSSSSSSSSATGTTGTVGDVADDESQTTDNTATQTTGNTAIGNNTNNSQTNVDANADETTIADESTPTAASESANDESKDASDTDSQTTITDDESPAAGNSGISGGIVALIIAGIVVVFGVIITILSKKGIIKPLRR